jgi:hypothetical protein
MVTIVKESNPMSDQETVSGGCACGAVRYEFSAEPAAAINCHCRDCQRASGAGFAPCLIVWEESFRFVSGEPKYHTKISERGETMLRGFCVECGSPLGILEPHRPKLVFLPAASLDEPARYKPTMDIYTDSSHPWDVLDPVLEHHPSMPPTIPDDFGV